MTLPKQTRNLSVVYFLYRMIQIDGFFHLSDRLLNIIYWSLYSNKVASIIFHAKYFTVFEKHITRREFKLASNTKSGTASETA
jgi:hypothetical protein